MKRCTQWALPALLLWVLGHGSADGQGFGSFRDGDFGGGYTSQGFRDGSFGGGYTPQGFRSGSFGGGYTSQGFRSGSFGGGYTSQGFRDGSFGGGNVTGAFRDGSFAGYPSFRGGYGPNSPMVNSVRSAPISVDAGVAAGPLGRVVWGGAGNGANIGASNGAGPRFATDIGTAPAVSVKPATRYWSDNTMAARANLIRVSFGYFTAFNPSWYAANPGAFAAPAWNTGAAWRGAPWTSVDSFCAIKSSPIYFDYGKSIVFIDGNVNVDGQDLGTTQQYATQAIALADSGQKAQAPQAAEWTALGVFALAQGDESSSNYLFQLGVNHEGILRGNYYDGLLNLTTPVFGAVDKKTQRAAWTVGKNNDRVFETGIYNLTKSETPVLVHFGADRTQQMLLVRVVQPGN